MAASTACYLNKFTRADIWVQATLVAIALIDYGYRVVPETPNSRKEDEPNSRYSRFFNNFSRQEP